MQPEIPALPLVAVVGGGPAGLRAAEILSERADGAWRVAIFEGKPSVGRKFLVAGRGGLNLTHSEDRAQFVSRYGDEAEAARWADLLAEFDPGGLRAWAADLGVGTFVGTSGRVFPVGQQAAGLLRRWVVRLRERGVVFHVRHRWEELTATDAGWRLGFATGAGRVETTASAVVFALGGASWPQTGSDGHWVGAFREQLGVPVSPWQAANCGWEVGWRPEFLAVAEGLPLKNLALRAGAAGRPVRGEALVTNYGLEGGAVYRLGPALRSLTDRVELHLDFKPDADPATLAARLPAGNNVVDLEIVAQRWRLAPAARALLEFHGPGRRADPAAWMAAVKDFALPVRGPRPVAEAISSAGGVRWEAVAAATLGLRRRPGVFLAGEMLDWEAPTGGYLLQGCFATGTRAGRSAAEFLQRRKVEG